MESFTQCYKLLHFTMNVESAGNASLDQQSVTKVPAGHISVGFNKPRAWWNSPK